MKKHKPRNRKWQKPPRFEIPQDSSDLAKFEQQDSEIYRQQITNRSNYLLSRSSRLIDESQELIATSRELIATSKELLGQSEQLII